MIVIGRLLAFLMVFVAPCVIAAWIATRLKQPLAAFLTGWVLTPVVGTAAVFLAYPLIRATSDPNSDGTFVIMFPFLLAGIGFFVGIVSGVIAGRSPKPTVAVDAK